MEQHQVIADGLNYMLGRYIRIAFHTPNKYPDKPLSSDMQSSHQLSPEQHERLMQAKYG